MEMPGLTEAISKAVADVLVSEGGGGFLNGWFFMADYIDSDGGPSWIYSCADDQRMITTLGLCRWALGIAEYEMTKHLSET